ncbi:glycosyltransferase family 2 protein [Affinirhizobium pseudoryzae]|uniref:glycosyltransferase family 2 protein n=1 Tax=Allorhizobium pseudoryzae TaxID=379684 RepID=UPI0013ECFD96|nr:glycosyltransferase family 2 protein [Allorhizobium pseudoryzae]
MAFSFKVSADVQAVPSGGEHAWQSNGDDPFFDLRFTNFREPVIVIHLRTETGLLDPKIYIDRGAGYREKDAVSFEPGASFVFLADVGRSGLLRHLRVDPASFPCRFHLSFEFHPDRATAEAAISVRLASDMVGAARQDLGKLPRFALPVPKLSFRRNRSDAQKYADAHYELAGRESFPLRPFADETWLSIIVPVYNAPPRYLNDLVRSFRQQHVAGVELILSDDASPSEETRHWLASTKRPKNVHVVRNERNGGIGMATNAGLVTAKGTWVTFLDHDDVFAPHALKMIAQALQQHPDMMFLYTDELVVDDKLHPKGLLLKPAYDPVLLSGVNYINHFSVYRRDRLVAVGALREGFDGSQDYDMLLRYLKGVPDHKVFHLPYPAYWWRRNGQTYSRRFLDSATDAARRALRDRYAASAEDGLSVGPALTETLHRLQFTQPETVGLPELSVIVPSKDSFELIERVLRDLYEKTDYPNLEVIVVDNGSTDPRVLALYDRYQKDSPGFQALVTEEKFNFARSINRGMQAATGEHFLVLNNDIEVIDGAWLREMVDCLHYGDVGIVGAKLLYPNDKIQHAGVIAGFGGLAGHWYLNKPKDFGGPMNRLHVRNSMTCVTGAAMLISKACANAVGPWDEENFAVAYNDVDYCLRAYKAGFRSVWTPFACLYHHESVSRGSDMIGERKRRFEREKDNLRRIHATTVFDDPALNPGYEKRHSTPSLEAPRLLAKPRTWWP